MTLPVKVFCTEWHLQKSPALDRVLVEPLKQHIDFEVVRWDARRIDKCLPSDCVSVFFLNLPPEDLLRDSGRRVIWIPMWDAVHAYTTSFWRTLPKHLRVVAFCDEVAKRAGAAGVPVLKLRYFVRPDAKNRAHWSNGRILFYWNRTGLIDLSFLKRLCRALKVEKLLYRNLPDRRLGNDGLELPDYIDKTKVQRLSDTWCFEEYQNAMHEANLFFAPRSREGIGLAFLEAMSRGCVVLACDQPTMNEYIEPNRNGILFSLPFHLRAAPRIMPWLHRINLRNVKMPRMVLRVPRNIESLSELPLERIGEKAFADHEKGYEKWRQDLEAYRSFIAEW